MKIVHVVEPLAGGMVDFMMSLVKNLSADSHLIIHGSREHYIPLDEVKEKLHFSNVNFINWRFAGRSIKPWKDFRAFVELFIMLKKLKQNGVKKRVWKRSCELLNDFICRYRQHIFRS